MQRKINKKAVIIVIAIGGLILFITLLVRTCGSSVKQELEFAKATTGPIKRTISVTGVIEVTDAHRILSKTPGIIDRVYVDFNDNVRKGQVLASLDSTEIEQKLMKLSAQLESVNLELTIAKEEIEGKKGLYKENLISKVSMQKAELDYKTALMKHKQIQLDYNLVQKQRNNARIVSPVNGIIISREIEANVPADITKTLFIIAPSLKNMHLIISVDESDIGIIRKGQEVYFTVSAYPDEKFYGKIEQVRINPIQKGVLVSYQSLVLCSNDKLLLKPGMTATATVVVAEKAKALRVPNQAFLVSPIEVEFDSDKMYLWIKSGSFTSGLPVKKVEVMTGIRGDIFTEVTKNLNEGDEVLVKVIKKGKTDAK